jgi:hypothetical protein
MFQQEYYDQLVAKGLTVAAERYVSTYGDRKQESLFDVPAVEVKPEGHVTVTCAKVRCGVKATMARSEANRWFCDTHRWVTDDKPVEEIPAVTPDANVKTRIRFNGCNYDVLNVTDDGVSFLLRNGKVRTLESSKVEWV